MAKDSLPTHQAGRSYGGGELGGGPCRSELGVLQGTQPETDTELLGERVSQEPWELEDL